MHLLIHVDPGNGMMAFTSNKINGTINRLTRIGPIHHVYMEIKQ